MKTAQKSIPLCDVIDTSISTASMEAPRSVTSHARYTAALVRKQHRMQIKQVALFLALFMFALIYVICRDASRDCQLVQMLGIVIICFITSLTCFLLRHKRFKPITMAEIIDLPTAADIVKARRQQLP